MAHIGTGSLGHPNTPALSIVYELIAADGYVPNCWWAGRTALNVTPYTNVKSLVSRSMAVTLHEPASCRVVTCEDEPDPLSSYCNSASNV